MPDCTYRSSGYAGDILQASRLMIDCKVANVRLREFVMHLSFVTLIAGCLLIGSSPAYAKWSGHGYPVYVYGMGYHGLHYPYGFNQQRPIGSRRSLVPPSNAGSVRPVVPRDVGSSPLF